MWQGDLQNWVFTTAPLGTDEAVKAAREALQKRASEPAVTLARRALHAYDLVPSVYEGQHSRAFFLLCEVVATFPYLRRCLATPQVRTLHFEMSPGGFVDAVLKLAPMADWHATSLSGEVYEHIRLAKKVNGHARLLHDSIVQEVGQAMFVTVQGGSAQDVTLALNVLHPDGVLVVVCSKPNAPEIQECLAEFEHVHLCKPRTMLPSTSECVLVAYRRVSQPVAVSPSSLAAWGQAIDILQDHERTAVTESLHLATYLTQIDIKGHADTQKFYLEHLATNSSRIGKAQQLLNFIFKNGIQE